ncbi:MAG TPA: YdeI/OmpD-associated family protein [bacterium]|nr:YdeI/OmpD-associated family protein [bacterium]
MRIAILSSRDLVVLWNGLSPLARNEWICWVTTAKKEETRKDHIARLVDNLRDGKKRPCCWPGCPHRRESAQKWFK